MSLDLLLASGNSVIVTLIPLVLRGTLRELREMAVGSSAWVEVEERCEQVVERRLLHKCKSTAKTSSLFLSPDPTKLISRIRIRLSVHVLFASSLKKIVQHV